MNLRDILSAFKAGELAEDAAERAITGTFFRDLGHSTVDSDRARRTGAAEVVYGAQKSPAQIADVVAALAQTGQNVLVTRTDEQAFAQVRSVAPDATYHAEARLITWVRTPAATAQTRVAVVTAGTSDLRVAEEAALTAEFYGNPVDRINDVGVAGVHRLLAKVDALREAP